jgi:tetraacyldisaccharide 4'-kinase
LLSPSQFRDLVSGRQRGLGPSALRGALRVAECLYTAAVRRRNRRFDLGAADIFRVEVPVVSVGNLTLGGTGKTPLVEWLARWFRQQDVRVALVSRGYGASADGPNDEALELEQSLPDVPHVQNADRVAAAREAIKAFQCQAIVLDDGFQHRRLARNLDIVLLDALEPLGFGHVFPRGTLREPVDGLRRADVVAISRADLLDEPARAELRQTISKHAPQAVVAEMVHAPRRLLSATGGQAPLDSLRNQAVAAFCGVGNPAGFRHTLAACGCRVAGFREFPDHHRYTPADVDRLAAWAQELDVSAALCTRKDLVKLAVDNLGGRPLWAVGVELEFLVGQQDVESRLRALLPIGYPEST